MHVLGSVSVPWGWLTKQQKFVSQLCCLEVQIRLLSGLGAGSPGRKREASSWASSPHPFWFQYKRLPQAHVFEHEVPNE